MFGKMNKKMGKWLCWVEITIVPRGLRTLRERKGQGTTEYAILVGVLVVIAIIAVIAFRGKLQELWDGIIAGINGL
jgi:Flp pilus assembly pilin Flp